MSQENIDLVAELTMTEHQSYSGYRYGHFELELHRGVADAPYDKAPWTYLYEYQSDYVDFRINAYYGNPEICEGAAYGVQYGYKTHDLVDLAHADRYARGMKRVEKAYRAHCAANGESKSFGQQVIYLLKALGVKVAYVRMPEGQYGAMHRDWRGLRTPNDIMDHIDRTIQEHRERQREAVEAA